MITWRIYVAAGIFAGLVALVLWSRHESHRADAAAAKAASLEASIEALNKARATEQADRSRSDDIAKKHAEDLAALAAVPPIAGVRCRAAHPTVPAEGHSAAESHDPAAAPHEGVPAEDPLGAERDVSVGADYFGSNCQAVTLTLIRLQEFEAKRTH